MKQAVLIFTSYVLLSVTPLHAQTPISCELEPAFGLLNMGTGDARFADLCVDRAAGAVSGTLSLSGLTLTKDNGKDFTFEDVENGSRDMMQIAPVIVSTYHGGLVDDQSPELSVLSGRDVFRGFIFDQLAAADALAPNFYMFLSMGLHDTGTVPYLFAGQAAFEGGVTTVTIQDHPEYSVAKNTEGAIELTVADDGSASGTGVLEAENIRSAGYQKDEWVSISVTFDDIRGYATGPTGQVIKTYALVTGEITDAEGDVRTSRGSAEIFFYDPSMRE